ncbi:MAG: hypothetical protein K8E24_012460 [Methanobacterium paludis]|nr:hypothetical protein [Methanobacterium paludis]
MYLEGVQIFIIYFKLPAKYTNRLLLKKGDLIVYEFRTLDNKDRIVVCNVGKKILYPHEIVSESGYNCMCNKMVKVLRVKREVFE